MFDLKINYTRIDLNEYSTNLIPERVGVYVITHTPDNINAEKYVGSTTNLHKRMGGHCNKNIIYVDLYVTDDINIAQSLERIFIELIKPATNVISLNLSETDREILYELDKDNNIREHIHNNIVKIGYRYLKYISHDEKVYEPPKFEIRRVQLIAGVTPTISIPIKYGFKKGDSVKVEQMDEKTVKLTKVE